MDMDARRLKNFLDILRREYGDSPKKFEIETGYSANMVSQIKTGKKHVADRLARKLEGLMKLEPGALDAANPTVHDRPQPKATRWPFSVSPSDFENLSPRLQREIDAALTRMVLGAQAEDVLRKQAK